MSATVEILRDRAGIPHIYADTTANAYFGLGYAMAEDRLWQMDRLRRRALGRQAEILGPDFVQSDLMHRAVGIPEIAEREVDQTDPQTRDILESFVGGINRHIETHPHDLPPEFSLLGYEPEPFTVSDVIATLRGLWWSLNGRLYTISTGETAGLLPDHLRDAFLEPEASELRILPPDVPYPRSSTATNGHVGTSDGSGSNNWAVAGSRTALGKAILCGDPHQPFWIPSSWYEYAIHGPEDDAAGAGPVGVPGLWWGSNGSIAWAITNNAASTRDLYREPPEATFTEREVVVNVRGQAPVRHTQRASTTGPIMNHVLVDVDHDPPLALRWVGQEHLNDVRAAIALGRARDWNAFRAALRDWSVPIFNFVYADAGGHVGYQCAGRVPIRGRVTRGYRSATDPRDSWQSYVPFDALPSAYDPPRGYVASANERVAPDDYAYSMHGAFGGGYRAQRIHQILGAPAAFDREQAVALQNDVKSCRAERLCPPLLERLGNTPDAQLVRATLDGWDYRYTLESAAPTLFDTFMEVWQARVIGARFPERLHAQVLSQGGMAARLLEHGDTVGWFAGDLSAELDTAATETVRRLRERYGDEPTSWHWQQAHLAHWRHPLGNAEFDIGPASVDGGSETVRNTGMVGALGGSEYRMVVDFAEPERFWAVQNIGNSGVPTSSHYRDQFEDWRAGRYHAVSLRRADVERDSESTVVIDVAPVGVQ